jgi:hypothetical protein
MRSSKPLGLVFVLTILALGFLGPVTSSRAGSISVTITRERNIVTGVTLIKSIDITTPSPSTGYTLQSNNTNGTKGTVSTGTTNSGTGQILLNYPSGITDPPSFTLIVGSGASAEHFNGFINSSASILSKEERAAGVPSFILPQSPIVPFSFQAFGVSGLGPAYEQFVLTNTSTQNAYQLSSLQIYTGLNLSYFNLENYASPAAIATGTLDSDIVANLGHPAIVPVAGLQADPLLTFSTLPVDPRSYELLIGTAQAIESDGSLGPPIDFAFAATVPEPWSIILLAPAMLLLGRICLARRRAIMNS